MKPSSHLQIASGSGTGGFIFLNHNASTGTVPYIRIEFSLIRKGVHDQRLTTWHSMGDLTQNYPLGYLVPGEYELCEIRGMDGFGNVVTTTPDHMEFQVQPIPAPTPAPAAPPPAPVPSTPPAASTPAPPATPATPPANSVKWGGIGGMIVILSILTLVLLWKGRPQEWTCKTTRNAPVVTLAPEPQLAPMVPNVQVPPRTSRTTPVATPPMPKVSTTTPQPASYTPPLLKRGEDLEFKVPLDIIPIGANSVEAEAAEPIPPGRFMRVYVPEGLSLEVSVLKRLDPWVKLVTNEGKILSWTDHADRGPVRFIDINNASDEALLPRLIIHR